MQNPFICGPEAEVRQGKNVTDVAKQTGIQHLVYGSAGTGSRGTGIPSWETKLEIEEHVQALNLPVTILRPMAFMELMTDKKFFPTVGTWHVMPRLMGGGRRIFWISTDDLGAIAAKAFAAPHQFVGQELALASDVQSLDQCRVLYRAMMGRNPPRFPVPIWLFKRFEFVGRDLTPKWQWLRTATIALNTELAYSIHPEVLTVREWPMNQKKRAPR